MTHAAVGYRWQNSGLHPELCPAVTNIYTTSCRTLTTELRRCRASKVTYKPKPTPLAQTVSKIAAVGSRLERIVGRQRRIEDNPDCTTDPAIPSTYVNKQDRNGKPASINGARCRGRGLRQIQFAQPSPANLPSIKERHGALFPLFLLPSFRRVMRGAFADAFPAKSGTHDAPANTLAFSLLTLSIYFVG
jgi:hypothetical protein